MMHNIACDMLGCESSMWMWLIMKLYLGVTCLITWRTVDNKQSFHIIIVQLNSVPRFSIVPLPMFLSTSCTVGNIRLVVFAQHSVVKRKEKILLNRFCEF